MLLLLSVLKLNAQNSTWVFGWGAELNFEDGVPNTGSVGPIYSAEGTACISDEQGNFLFSSDGVNVYDRNGNIMSGGTGLMGHESSTQGVLIAPRPYDTEERFYHVFTASAQDNFNGNGGLYHSVVDMEGNNGLGEMIIAPELLLTNVGEKIHATMHADGHKIWILTHKGNSNEYHAFLLSCAGIDENNTVISETGDVVDFYTSYQGAIGALKISPDGSRIAMTHLIEIEPGIPGATKLQTGIFNNETGQVEILEILYESGELIQGYGVEFSPNSRFIYWSQLGTTIRRILRYDLLAEDVPPSRYEVANANNGQSYAALQLGPDNRIYIARSNGANFLSAIDNPNETDPQNLVFLDNAIGLNSLSTLGLPNDWNYLAKETQSVEDFEVALCEGNQADLSATYFEGVTYTWSSGKSGRELTVLAPGVYAAELVHPCFTKQENFIVEEVEIPTFEIIGNKEFCVGASTEVEILTDAELRWWDSDTNSTKSFDNAGVYPFALRSHMCTFNQQIQLTTLSLPKIDLNSTYFKCEGQSISIPAEVNFEDSFIWSTGSEEDTIDIHVPEAYSIMAKNSCGSAFKQVIVEDENCECDVFIPNTFSPNGDGVNDIFRPVCDCTISNYELTIYNRWGQLVFQTNSPEKGWNADFNDRNHYSQNNLYSYTLKGGVIKNGKRRVLDYKGSITLIR